METKTTYYYKLVRDKIPSQIEKSGKKCSFRNIANDSEYLHLLREKLIEEFDEYRDAKTGDEQIEELADILEVIYAMNDFYNRHQLQRRYNDILNKLFEKHSEKGGFDNRIFLEYVEED